MSGKSGQSAMASALELVECAFVVVRRAGLNGLTLYFVGTAPFVLALLYFWSDMANDAFAYQRVALESFVLAVLFFWMKTWQSVYAGRLREVVTAAAASPLTPSRWLRIAMRQGITHATAFVVLPIALVALAPFGYAYAFYQNATIQEEGSEQSLRAFWADAWRHARVWPMQNHLLMWLISPIVLLFTAGVFFLVLPVMQYAAPEWTETLLRIYATVLIIILLPLSPLGMIVALNIAAALSFLPEMLRMLGGIETAFTVNASGMVSPTFFVLVCGLTYLCLDPFLKAAYVLRCFQRDSREDGQDLRIRLRTTASLVSRGLILVLLASLFAMGAGAHAQDIPETAAAELDTALDRVLEGRDYAWRAPRERPEAEGALGTFLQGLSEGTAEMWRWVRGAVDDFFDWIGDRFFGGGQRSSDDSGVNRTTLQFIMYALVVILIGLLAVLAWRAWRSQRAVQTIVGEVVVTPPPDLEDESTSADALPEDGWVQLGRELLEQGDYRLAMRAFFLAKLAAIARRDLIRIARHKSNRDYARELARIAHAEEDLVGTFGASVRTFERVWYGMHEITREGVEHFLEAPREALTDGA